MQFLNKTWIKCANFTIFLIKNKEKLQENVIFFFNFLIYLIFGNRFSIFYGHINI